MADDESHGEWRFSVDEFDDSPPSAGETGTSDGESVDDERDDEGNVAGEFAPTVPVVPEMPQLENAVFVTLGAALTVLALASVIGGPSFGLVDAFVVVATIGALGALVYGILLRLTPEA